MTIVKNIVLFVVFEDLSSCKRYEDQTSYRILPKKKSLSKSDNRTTVCAKVRGRLPSSAKP